MVPRRKSCTRPKTGSGSRSGISKPRMIPPSKGRRVSSTRTRSRKRIRVVELPSLFLIVRMSGTTNETERGGTPGFRIVMKVLGTIHRGLYRASGGKLGRTFFGAPVLLLTMIGRKTGRPRTWPLAYLPEGDRLIVIA